MTLFKSRSPAADPKSAKPLTAYQRHKEQARTRQRKNSASDREISTDFPTLTAAQLKIKERCLTDLAFALKTLFPARFAMEFGPDQLELIKDLQRAIELGEQAVRAMPRGTGKTSIMVAACIWAILRGLHAMVAIIAATSEAAKELMEQIEVNAHTNDELYLYFPEVFHAIRKLEGIKQRRLLWEGKPIIQVWKKTHIVFPNLPKSPSSSAVVKGVGILGRVRGMNQPHPDGRVLRPTLVLLDDIQTKQSAMKEGQVTKRLGVVAADVLGLAPPGKKLSALCAVTVIVTDDAADQLLDNEKFPQWHGKRRPLLYGEPKHPELWAEYDELRREGLRLDQGISKATALYKKHRKQMDAGMKAAWPARFNPDELSGIQYAMNLKLTDEVVFACEYQNCPLVEESSTAQTDPNEVILRTINLKRFQLPLETEYLTAGIDCQSHYLVRTVTGWGLDCSGHVPEYGTWPKQNQAQFTRRTASPTIQDRFPKLSSDEQLYSALTHAVAELMGMKFTRADGLELRLRKICLDARWMTAVVTRFVRQSEFRDILLPCMGLPTKLGGHINDKPPATGEISRDGFRLPPLRAGQVARVCAFESNDFISGVHEALQKPVGSPGSLTLFDAPAHLHRCWASQVCAEYSMQAEAKGRRHTLWQLKPAKDDNDFLDATKLGRLGAFVLGLIPTYQKPKPKGSPGHKCEPKYASI